MKLFRSLRRCSQSFRFALKGGWQSVLVFLLYTMHCSIVLSHRIATLVACLLGIDWSYKEGRRWSRLIASVLFCRRFSLDVFAQCSADSSVDFYQMHSCYLYLYYTCKWTRN